jgi:hypothetical protein
VAEEVHGPALARGVRRLDPSFARAETALRVDLVTALLAAGELAEARVHVARATRLASEIRLGKRGG